ncbi:hypothetical protein KY328_02560 [Candidatus Woesearchaeota archaeon]|nr:hypothetical protein [Candidatus Woesearchaeota archaeon]MBW3021774.1 hypothetical protein [Candidatus Woesearchaeota archaeon]
MNQDIINKCKLLLQAYKEGKLGYMKMPEDSNPGFSDSETRLVYFTLPMSLNYQRDSYKLWEAALETYNDGGCRRVFDIKNSALMAEEEVRNLLIKHKVALQPNKHVTTWQKISKTIYENWGSISKMLEATGYDFLELKKIVQGEFKKGFPYLSGPKIFNYWSFIIQKYGKVKLKNSGFIEIAPDTHVTKCSVKLGVISEKEAETMSKEKLSEKWRVVLEGSGIKPIDMHPPLWFWSRNGFEFEL